MDIENTFKPYDTDKKSHGYLKFYEDAFGKYREKVRSFLEIGVHQGESLKAWRDYFPNAKIVGAEIRNPKNVKIKNESRISVEFGDATNENFIEQLIGKYKSFDIVLDDGSHMSNDMRKTFNLLWNHTNMIYCIEDLGTQYEHLDFPGRGRKFGQRFIENFDPFTRDLKNFIDDVMMLRTDIFKISFYKWQAYIFKENYGSKMERRSIPLGM